MATKTITITEEAYGKLKMRKKGNDSFSDVINRIAPYAKWEDFIGMSRTTSQHPCSHNLIPPVVWIVSKPTNEVSMSDWWFFRSQ